MRHGYGVKIYLLNELTKPRGLSLIALLSELLSDWKIALWFYQYLEEENLITNSEIPLVSIVQKWNLKDKNFPHDLAQNYNLETKSTDPKTRKAGF